MKDLDQIVTDLKTDMAKCKTATEQLTTSWRALTDVYRAQCDSLRKARDTFYTLKEHASNTRNKGVGDVRKIGISTARDYHLSLNSLSTSEDDADRFVEEIPRLQQKEKDTLEKINQIRAITSQWKNYEEPKPKCLCWQCEPNQMRMVVCSQCGNKRCPKANDHRNECTNSNEPGQKGSAYEDVK